MFPDPEHGTIQMLKIGTIEMLNNKADEQIDEQMSIDTAINIK
jgi:hypothetical protein